MGGGPYQQPYHQVPSCYWHPEAQAVARCLSCGRYVCPICMVSINRRHYCFACASLYGAPTHVTPPLARPVRPTGFKEVVFPGATWGVGESLVIFIIAFLAGSAVSFFLYRALVGVVTSTTALFLLIFFSSLCLYGILLGATYYSVHVRHGGNLAMLGLKYEGSGKGLLLGLGLGIPLFIGAMGLAYVSQLIFRPTDIDYVTRSVEEVSGGSVSGLMLTLFIITLVVLAPVCEEIFFRGYMYPALRNRMGMQPAMLINGFLFAAAHFDVVGFLPRFLLGYGLCYIYEKSRNLSGPMVGHALYNGLILFLSGVLQLF